MQLQLFLLADQQVIMDLTKCCVTFSKKIIRSTESKRYHLVNKGLWLPAILLQSAKFVLLKEQRVMFSSHLKTQHS